MTSKTFTPSLPDPAPAAAGGCGEGDPVNPFVPMQRWAVMGMLIFGAFYLFGVMGVALFNTGTGGISMAWVALSSGWLIFWTFYPFVNYKPEYGWCHPLILGACVSIVNMVMRSTTLFMGGLDEHIMLPDKWPEELNMIFAYGNLIHSLALIALYLGFARGPRLPVPQWNAPTAASSRLYLVLLIFLGISVAAFVLYIHLYGGLSSYAKSLAFGMAKKIEMADDNVDGIGPYAVATKMATIVAVVWVCAQASAFRNPVFWVLGLSALTMAYMSEGKRSGMIFPAILILLCWMLRNRQVPYLRLGLAAVAIFFLFGIMAMLRSSNWADTQHLNLSVLQETSLAEMASKSQEELLLRSGSASSFFAIIARVPKEEKLLLGKTYLEWGLRFMPREFWPDKPRGVDVQANQTFLGGDWGTPAGPVGEAYWNFHLPGVALVFFLVGVLKRWLADLLIRHPEAPGVMAIYMITLFYFEPSQNGFRLWIYAIVPALLMIRLGGLIRGRRQVERTFTPRIRPQSHAA
jgi:oligosaccharide repeat unit polymerase